MSNTEFLLNWLLNTLVAPTEVDNPKGVLVFAIIITIAILGFMTFLLIFTIKEDSFYRPWGLFFLTVVLCVPLLLGIWYLYFVGVKNYREYTEAKQTYEALYVDISNYNAEMLDERMSYTIYLNGNEVSYDTVSFAQYTVSIDDDNRVIYLST